MDKKEVLSEFKNKDYHFAKVGNEFRLIEEGNKTVFINREEEAGQILQQLRFQGIYERYIAESPAILCQYL